MLLIANQTKLDELLPPEQSVTSVNVSSAAPLSCDSHIMPLFRDADIEDDTPVLHRTHDSVWKSYAARNLRSMSDGSYLDTGSGSFMSDRVNLSESGSFESYQRIVLSPNGSFPTQPQLDGVVLGRDSLGEGNLADRSSDKTSSFSIDYPETLHPSQPARDNNKKDTTHGSGSIRRFTHFCDSEVHPKNLKNNKSSKITVGEGICQNMFTDSSRWSNLSVEKGRSVSASLDESMTGSHWAGFPRRLSQLHSVVASSTDLDFSDDFSKRERLVYDICSVNQDNVHIGPILYDRLKEKFLEP